PEPAVHVTAHFQRAIRGAADRAAVVTPARRRQKPLRVDIVLLEHLSAGGELHDEARVRIGRSLPIRDDAQVLEELLEGDDRWILARVLAGPEAEDGEGEQDHQELDLEEELPDRHCLIQEERAETALLLAQWNSGCGEMRTALEGYRRAGRRSTRLCR